MNLGTRRSCILRFDVQRGRAEEAAMQLRKLAVQSDTIPPSDKRLTGGRQRGRGRAQVPILGR